MRDARVENAPSASAGWLARFSTSFHRQALIARSFPPDTTTSPSPQPGNATCDAADACAPPRAPRRGRRRGGRRARLLARRRGARTSSRRRMCFFFFFLPLASLLARPGRRAPPFRRRTPPRRAARVRVRRRARARPGRDAVHERRVHHSRRVRTSRRLVVRASFLAVFSLRKLGRLRLRGVRRGGELVHAPAPDRGGFVSIPDTHARVQAAAHHLSRLVPAQRHARHEALVAVEAQRLESLVLRDVHHRHLAVVVRGVQTRADTVDHEMVDLIRVVRVRVDRATDRARLSARYASRYASRVVRVVAVVVDAVRRDASAVRSSPRRPRGRRARARPLRREACASMPSPPCR